MKTNKKLKICVVSIAIILLLAACDKSAHIINTDISNTTYGIVAEYNGDAFYINDGKLFRNINKHQLIAENIYSVQTYENELYYAQESNNELNIMKLDGDKAEPVTDLPYGHLRKFIIDSNNVYALIDSDIYYKPINETECSLIRSNVNNFLINDNNLYSIEGSLSADIPSDATHVDDLSNVNIESKLILCDMLGKEKAVIAENQSSFLITYAEDGIIYYDRDTHDLILYNNSQYSTVDNMWTASIISYEDSVIYSSIDENSVFSLSFANGKKETITYTAQDIVGIANGNIYTKEGDWMQVDI